MAYLVYNFHFVFRTKNSQRVISSQDARLLYSYICAISKRLECRVLQINGMPDHIHIAVTMSSGISPALYMREVKSRSSVWLKEHRDKFPHFEGWGKSYFGSVFTDEATDSVVRYIANQQQHHENKTFADEMRNIFPLTNLKGKEEYFLRDED